MRELLEEQEQKVRVIAITGHLEPEYLERARLCGMDKVYAKPFSVYKLG